MLNWIYESSTDSYNASFPCSFPRDMTIKLNLSHSYPGYRWMLVAKTEGATDFKIRTTIPADPDNYNIEDIKLRAERTIIRAINETIAGMANLTTAIAEDITEPMPDKLTMAKTLWAEYLTVPKTPEHDAIQINWRNFSAGCFTKYIETWFTKNFGVDVEILKAGD